MARERHKEEMLYCPVARFFADLEKVFGKQSEFFEHLNQSRIEFLRAIRSLVDKRIEDIEKKGAKQGKKMTKIKVD